MSNSKATTQKKSLRKDLVRTAEVIFQMIIRSTSIDCILFLILYDRYRMLVNFTSFNSRKRCLGCAQFIIVKYFWYTVYTHLKQRALWHMVFFFIVSFQKIVCGLSLSTIYYHLNENKIALSLSNIRKAI